ncbi:MAG TPA: hypothetical protein VGD71_10505 [Kribbella sp.]|jgi:hypothetical protein
MRNRFQLARRTAAAVAGVALAVTAAGALQASAAPAPTRIPDSTHAGHGARPAPVTHPGHNRPAPAAPSISISADSTTVRAGGNITFTGTTTGIADNTKVTVQSLQHGSWVNYAAWTRTSSDSYSVSVESSRIGVNTFRVATSATASSSVTVTVHK